MDDLTFSASAHRSEVAQIEGRFQSLTQSPLRAGLLRFLHASEAPAEATREQIKSLREVEREHVVRVLEDVGWNKKQAAQVLEISRGTLYRKIAEYGLGPEAQRGPSHGRPHGAGPS